MPNTTTPEPIPARFSTGLTLDGWEVVDSDGRSVTDSYSQRAAASIVAERLSNAAANGPAALRIALGCIEESDELSYTEEELAILAID